MKLFAVSRSWFNDLRSDKQGKLVLKAALPPRPSIFENSKSTAKAAAAEAAFVTDAEALGDDVVPEVTKNTGSGSMGTHGSGLLAGCSKFHG